jgi:hypothetical protein
MPLSLLLLMIGVLLLGVGVGYIASPRFVQWVITRDRRGQMWVRILGRERAIFVVRNYFSLFLIAAGIIALYYSYEYF